MLKNKVFPWINSLPGNQAVTLQQDGAIAHTTKIVQAWCKDNLKSFWSKEFWPPSSPDLNLMDFGIWWDMVHLGEKGLRCVTFKCGKIEEIKRILGENRKQNYSCYKVTKLSLASALLSLKGVDILNKLNSILKIIHLPLIFFKKNFIALFVFKLM